MVLPIPDGPCPQRAWERLRTGDVVCAADLVRAGLRPHDPRGRMDTMLKRWERGGYIRKADDRAYVMTDAGLRRARHPMLPTHLKTPTAKRDADAVRADRVLPRLAAMVRHDDERDDELAWRALRLLQTHLKIAELCTLGLSRGPIKATLKYWHDLGLVAPVPGIKESYSMTVKGRALAKAPPPPATTAGAEKRSAHQRMWTAIRILKNFDAAQLGWAAEVTIRTATSFCRLLTRAGYLTKIATASGQPVWRLGRRALGPFAPAIQHDRAARTTTLADPNSGERLCIERGRPLFFEGSC